MANFQTFDYGQVLSQGEGIKNARLQNQMLQQEQDPNSIRNQLLREQLSGARQGNVLAQKQEERSATQYAQQQELDRLKLLNAASAQVSADPTAINYWAPKLIDAGVLPPDYDYSSKTKEEIMKGAQTIYESTSKALGLSEPANKLISVGPETTLFDPQKGQPVFTAPAKQQPALTPGEAMRLAQAERFQQQNIGIKREELKSKEAALKAKPVSVSPTLQKELTDSDDVITSGQRTLDMLSEAQKLSKKAYSGVGAGVRAAITSNIPGVKSEAANATVDLDNIMKTQALESLKAVFTGAISNEERRALMDIQASSDKTPEQRSAIIARAKGLVQKRINANKKKAQAIRKGTYLTEDYNPYEDQQAPMIQPGARAPASPGGRFKIEVLP